MRAEYCHPFKRAEFFFLLWKILHTLLKKRCPYYISYNVFHGSAVTWIDPITAIPRFLLFYQINKIAVDNVIIIYLNVSIY